jgi:argininosuccinate synthase
VLLIYSGGLDTSVMLKWIQDRYDAEVVCLTVNLGQPGEDFDVIEGKAMALGALECHLVDARSEFAHAFLAPAIKANGMYGAGYPLFTALGRPLIAKLAVDYARKHAATRSPTAAPARATTRTARGDGGHARARAKVALVRGWQMGREERRLRARARHPTRAAPSTRRTRSTTTSGGARPRAADRGARPRTRRRRLQLARPELAPDEPELVTVALSAACPWP